MEELDFELVKLGIPAKTRHNEVAPGQFEIAPIFKDANVASDHNQLIMATLKKIAERHHLVALLHEKPFSGINGSGKHINWSMVDSLGRNLLDPGEKPHQNKRFLAFTSVVIEAVHRHSGALRMAIASHGNDHRLGANEAPPSIISVFTGDTLEKIFDSLIKGEEFSPREEKYLDTGVLELAEFFRDNTDRNRTSPFAFTGNRFEFRAVGSTQNIGFPLTVLQAAVADVLNDSNRFLQEKISSGVSRDEAVSELTKKWLTQSQRVIFNGDGYSQEWVQEAERRGLPNLQTTPEALRVLKDERSEFLVRMEAFNRDELTLRFNVLVERFNLNREIEFNALINITQQQVIPAVFHYKTVLAKSYLRQKEVGITANVELESLKKLNFSLETLSGKLEGLVNASSHLKTHHSIEEVSQLVVNEYYPLFEEVSQLVSQVEEMVADQYWPLPKYYDLLFVK